MVLVEDVLTEYIDTILYGYWQFKYFSFQIEVSGGYLFIKGLDRLIPSLRVQDSGYLFNKYIILRINLTNLVELIQHKPREEVFIQLQKFIKENKEVQSYFNSLR